MTTTRIKTQSVRLHRCTDPDFARQEALNLLWPLGHMPTIPEDHARRLLSYYLMAAALDGAGLDTIRAWATDQDDRQAVELLRAGPLGWADDCERILNLRGPYWSNILTAVRLALLPDRVSAA
ncbi:hypothetical protein [Streptomyces anulatus]|uniref:hypothetical protein n=1 Tax=Streptomyces anulatus TaxID=1892 RepID=UPI002F91DBFA|nr:hypothetical protein OH765_40030 [Streptomyces anulatus]WTE31774.1 hypothetical protein OHB50_39875 [Streptomyces anulatus]